MNKFEISDNWEYHCLEDKIKSINSFFTKNQKSQTIIFDFSNLKIVDSSGIILLIKYITLFENKKIQVQINNITKAHEEMLILYKQNYVHKEENFEKEPTILENIGKEAIETSGNFKNFLYFQGKLLNYFFYLLLHPSKIRFKAIINQIEVAAIPILPIIALALFLVGFVTAYQGSDQLGKFGASIIVIEMSTMSMFREIAPFLAAVIVAGRSASSFTAQIGTMKITEEISAMRTMGFDIDIFIIIPRIIALIIVMPLLVFLLIWLHYLEKWLL